MTPEERQMLTDLANKVAQTPAPPIDKEAEEFIRTRIGSRPDALYLMTQTVLIQNLALEQAKQQIQQLQQNSPAAQGSSSFLGGQGGTQSQGAYRASGAGAPQQNYSAPPPTYQTVPVSGAGSPAGGGSSFLRGAAQTAAGVAAGALAFEGIQSLFHGMGNAGGFGGSGLLGGGGVGGYGAPEETVINNYYDNPQTESRDDFANGDRDNLDNTQYADTSQDYDDTSDTSGDDFSGDDDGSGGDFLA
jgi:hypothetical protein